ncbi:MAG TPA: Maf family protein [Terriglobales bacterium]|jgi:septum formation protein|nr:Maf family protein [Terriglobales bacterium]
MLILASASPRRQELLRSAKIEFSVRPANIIEISRPDEAPEVYVRRLAREKAQAVAAQIAVGDVVLGADTEVVLDPRSGTPLGKPRDADDAARMLGLLSGRSHYVLTGVCLLWIDASDQMQSADASETTIVHFQQISEQEILDYVATAEPLDKAGAYAIQGIASRWIPRIEGCYFNVVGLPVPLVYRMLRERAPQAVTRS